MARPSSLLLLFASCVSQLWAQGTTGGKLPPAPPPVAKKTAPAAVEEGTGEAAPDAEKPKAPPQAGSEQPPPRGSRRPSPYRPPPRGPPPMPDGDGYFHENFEYPHPHDMYPPPPYPGAQPPPPPYYGHPPPPEFHKPPPPPPRRPQPLRELTKAQIHFLFPRMDGNKDGKITLEELRMFSLDTEKKLVSHMFRMPKGLDTDKDGALSREELKTDLERHTNEKLQEAKKRKTSNDEDPEKETALQESRFEMADADKDGKLVGDELLVFFHPDFHHELSMLEIRELLKKEDKNQDGSLDPGEFHPDEDFGRYDTDKDGLISLDELHAWYSGLHEFNVAMEKLMKLADQDGNGLSLEELLAARGSLKKTRANHFLLGWAASHEEL